MTETRRRVLLVDDNDDSRNIYRLILEYGGLEVVEARDGREALATARGERPDLILMDISIPHTDGWEASRILKSEEATSRIPIVALSAHALASDRAKSAAAGCDEHLAKPASPALVLAHVTRLLERGGSTAG